MSVGADAASAERGAHPPQRAEPGHELLSLPGATPRPSTTASSAPRGKPPRRRAASAAASSAAAALRVSGRRLAPAGAMPTGKASKDGTRLLPRPATMKPWPARSAAAKPAEPGGSRRRQADTSRIGCRAEKAGRALAPSGSGAQVLRQHAHHAGRDRGVPRRGERDGGAVRQQPSFQHRAREHLAARGAYARRKPQGARPSASSTRAATRSPSAMPAGSVPAGKGASGSPVSSASASQRRDLLRRNLGHGRRYRIVSSSWKPPSGGASTATGASVSTAAVELLRQPGADAPERRR